jgi:hypothetical protein
VLDDNGNYSRTTLISDIDGGAHSGVIRYTAGSEVEFFVDGTLKGSISNPNLSGFNPDIGHFQVRNPGSGTDFQLGVGGLRVSEKP